MIPKPIRAAPSTANEAGSGVVMVIEAGVTSVSEQAIGPGVVVNAACEHASDKDADCPTMKGLGPALVSADNVPVKFSANAPATVAVVGVIAPTSCSKVNVNVKLPPPLFVVGTVTVKFGLVVVGNGGIGIVFALFRTAVDPFATNR